MMDKENQGLNLDQDFVADLGVPFICPNCNELFGSQEYLSQHSDICHGMKHDFLPGTDNDTYQAKNYNGCQQNGSHSSHSLTVSYPENARPYNFHHNLMSSSAMLEQEANYQRHYPTTEETSYSSFPMDSLESPLGYQISNHQPTQEFSRPSMQRNDVLLSSTTENAHSYHQLPPQYSSIPTDPKPTISTESVSQQLSPGSQPVSCPGCHNTYINQWFLDQHVKHCMTMPDIQNNGMSNACAEVQDKNKGPIPCPRCKMLYMNQFFLDQHMLSCSSVEQSRHQSDMVTPVTSQSFSHCSEGVTAQQTSAEENMRLKSIPASNITAQTVQSTVSVTTSQQTSEMIKVDNAAVFIHTCPHCGKNFAQKSSLEEHIRTHTGEKPFDCEECGHKFVNKSNLKKHYRTHTQEKPYQCTLCGDSFSIRTGLTRHLRTHTGERPFECTVCGQRFSSAGNLKKHMILHTGEKDFGCKVCGRRFQNEGGLKAHVLLHSGEKSYQCPMCEAAFLHRGGLQAHFRTHTGEKPFPCNYCDLTFARRGGLKAHLRTHTGEKPFVCSECGQAFAHKSNLNAHNRTHTGEKPYGCTYCDQKFAHKSNLKKHMNTHVDRIVASSPAGSLSDSSCAVSDTSVASSTPVISAVTKMTSVMVSPFSDDSDSSFFDLIDMLEHPSTQALLQT